MIKPQASSAVAYCPTASVPVADRRSEGVAILGGRGVEVEGAVLPSGDRDRLQPGQAAEQLGRHRHALTHGAEHVERSERFDRLPDAAEMAIEHDDLGLVLHAGPVRHGQSEVLVVVENGDANAHDRPSFAASAMSLRASRSVACSRS